MKKFLRDSLLTATLALGGHESSFAQSQEAKPTELQVKNEQEKLKTELPETKDKEPLLKLTYFGLETLGLGQYREIAPEYAWKSRNGKVGGFGFVDQRLNPNSTFTNHNINYKPSNKLPISATAEAGLVGDKGFLSAGAQFDFKSLPRVNKVFDAATVSYLHRITGVSPEQEILFVWDTKDAPIIPDKLSVSGEGFYRVRPRSTTNYGQPQVLFKIKKFDRVKGLIQFETAGKSFQISVGAKFYIR